MAQARSLCVFCGTSDGGHLMHRAAAARLGTLMAERGLRLIYGGGNIGLMGALANAVLEAGGAVTGVIPRHLVQAEAAHKGLTEMILVESMHERKHWMFSLADAFAVLPGGLGTLDETIEIVTWKLLGLHDKPIVLVDSDGYWGPLTTLIDHIVANRFAPAEIKGLFTIVNDVEALLPALEAAPAPKLKPLAERF